MKKYIQHMQETRTPHERRQASMQIAGIVTAVLFVGWITTLGVRLSSSQSNVANDDGASNTAATLQAVQNGSSTWLGY